MLGRRKLRKPSISKEGLHYNNAFLNLNQKQEILHWLQQIHPIWEMRYSPSNPPPPQDQQRSLLRPVYWLGNWQFACLNYYHPPKGIENRCVEAEPFPNVLQVIVDKIEAIARRMFPLSTFPKSWRFNTCLINYYGSRIEKGKPIDLARVGEHRDYEPGPVASVSLGERALFQFVSSKKPGQRDGVVLQQWLEDGSLQIFGGPVWKDKLFHRVQRVEQKSRLELPVQFSQFEVRRINFTFRHVPWEHIVKLNELPQTKFEDIRQYVEALAQNSNYWRDQLRGKI